MSEIGALAVFCGSKTGNNPAHREAATRLGEAMAARGIRLVYGGGSIGLMGVMAVAARQAGGHVTGVIPDFLVKYEVADHEVTELVVVDSMHDRKRRVFELADGFVVLPGGLGTLDEVIEIVTWKQLRLHAKPVVLVDIEGCWRPLQALVDSIVSQGFAHPAVGELFSVVVDVNDVFRALAAAPEPKPEVLTSHL
ncbi:MAG: TIGR00730 family Rossman fold protein [Rhodospirillales bacterium]|jgi:hypothetical protein|nr:TIGR00730 family Rossman fold protein [Rhodospirillales bacterium]